MENHLSRPELEDALRQGRGSEIRSSATLRQRQLYVAVAKEAAGGGKVVYRASLPLTGLGQVRTTLWLCGAIGIFMGLVAALIAAHYAAGRVVEPLQSLTRAARSLAEGEPVRVEDAPDEMGELSGAFNRMAEHLAAAHEKLKKESDRLAGILQGMDDGVIAVDRDGTLTLMTCRAQELLGPVPATADRLAACGLNYMEIRRLMEQAAGGEGPLRDTLILEGGGTPERVLQV